MQVSSYYLEWPLYNLFFVQAVAQGFESFNLSLEIAAR